jgi:hypothetical protein
MRYVVCWTMRANGTSQENEASARRNLEVFSKWTPAAEPQLMLARLDGRGGFGVLETDDPAAVARDAAIFAPDLEVNLYPVIEVEQFVPIAQQALEFRASV